jgi:hypothetical protein
VAEVAGRMFPVLEGMEAPVVFMAGAVVVVAPRLTGLTRALAAMGLME